jgi:CBS domain-containing protein
VLVTAKSLMTTRFPLFGCEHQTREAAWLLTETQKFKRSINPEPLFLQDRNGALFGELSRWHVLKALIEGSDPDEDEGLDDRQVAKLLRRNFTRRINHIARTDVVHQRPDTPITALLRASTDNDQAVVPICDDGGRLKGYCMSHAMLIGLQDSLARLEAVEAEEEAAANADQVEASEPLGDELGDRNDG